MAQLKGARPTRVQGYAVVGDRLFVAGQFTNVNGVADTAGLVALNAVTDRKSVV